MYKNANKEIIDHIKSLAADTADSLLELEQLGLLSDKQSDMIAKKLDRLFELRLKQMLKCTTKKTEPRVVNL